MSNYNNEEFIKKMKAEKPEKLKIAAQTVKAMLGDKASGLDALLNNDKALNELAKKISPNDLGKITSLIDNPEMLKALLSSDKAKKGLKNFFENK